MIHARVMWQTFSYVTLMSEIKSPRRLIFFFFWFKKIFFGGETYASHTRYRLDNTCYLIFFFVFLRERFYQLICTLYQWLNWVVQLKKTVKTNLELVYLDLLLRWWWRGPIESLKFFLTVLCVIPSDFFYTLSRYARPIFFFWFKAKVITDFFFFLVVHFSFLISSVWSKFFLATTENKNKNKQ